MRRWFLAGLLGMVAAVHAQEPQGNFNRPELEAQARAGSAEAQYELGTRLARSDAKAGVEWLERAAGQGHVKAQQLLGGLYATGRGVPKDLALARKYYGLAAEAGDPATLVLLAAVLVKSEGGLAADFIRAEALLRQAVAQGSVKGAYFLGAILLGSPQEAGRGDPLEGLALLRQAAQQGESAAAYRLFGVYRSGAPQIPANEREAVRWLTVAARGGSVGAQVELAAALRAGQLGLGKEAAEAYFWISLAAQKLHPGALVARGTYEKELTPNEIAAVHQQVRDWKPAVPVQAVGRVPLAAVRIARMFEIVDLTRENFAATLRGCVPSLSAASVDRFAQTWTPNQNAAATYRHAGSGGVLGVQGAAAVCVAHSEAGHPIFATEALRGTMEPDGVPAEVVEQWFTTIALEMARKGYAEVVFQSSDAGNAFTAVYKASGPTGLTVEYRTALRRPGEYDPAKYDAVFIHPGFTQLRIRRYGQKQEKFVLQHRFGAEPAVAQPAFIGPSGVPSSN